jgi:hypothetical protein
VRLHALDDTGADRTDFSQYDSTDTPRRTPSRDEQQRLVAVRGLVHRNDPW